MIIINRTKIFIFSIIAAVIVFITGIIYYRISITTNNKFEKANKIYIMASPYYIKCLSLNNYSLISSINIDGGTDMVSANNKLYVAERGNPENEGIGRLSVIENGKIIKKISLKYALPDKIRYNFYNSKIYVTHVPRIVDTKENCIAVVDGRTNTEIANIPYNYGIEDLAFTKDNKMIISSWNINSDGYKLDIMDLSNYRIIKTIPTNVKFISIYCSDNFIYAVTGEASDNYLYKINMLSGNIVNRIKLHFNSPYRIYSKIINNKQCLVITHLDYDNLEGDQISVIEIPDDKIINEITGATYPYSIETFNNKIFVADWNDSEILIFYKNKKIKSLNVDCPMSVNISK